MNMGRVCLVITPLLFMVHFHTNFGMEHRSRWDGRGGAPGSTPQEKKPTGLTGPHLEGAGQQKKTTSGSGKRQTGGHGS